MHRDIYFSRNEPCPIVVVVGGDPMLFLVGANELSMSEYEWAGGVRGEAIEVIKGKYTGLPILTRAEIPIEVFCNYADPMEEGPFGGWTGYYVSGSRTLLDGNEIYSHPLQIWGVNDMAKTKIVIGMSGASGQNYGIVLLQELKRIQVETHLVLSKWSRINIDEETDFELEEVTKLADYVYDEEDVGARISSGSFRHKGMVIVPCSIKTLSGVANSWNENLLIRAADVTLKERRPLILVVRETPFHKGHLELMLKAANMGAVILPPVPAFYNRPKAISDIVNQTVARIIDQLGLEHNLIQEWQGINYKEEISR